MQPDQHIREPVIPTSTFPTIPALNAPGLMGLPQCKRLLNRVSVYEGRHGLPGPGSRILVALSGGPDSVALLTAVKLLSPARQWEIGAAHVNYHLRGEDSDSDESYCGALTSSWEVPLHTMHPAPPGSGTMNRQVWARDVRYQFFDELASREGFDFIAIGHQGDDQAETVAAAVLDAAGTFALGGIPPRRGKVIRPLFYCDRPLILEFLSSLEVPFREDRSNRDPQYQRNRVRHSVLPAWSLENPGIAEGLARLGEQVWQQSEYLMRVAADLVSGASRRESADRIVLDAGALASYDRALDPFVLRILFRRLGAPVVPAPAIVDRFSTLRERAARGRLEQDEMMIERSKDCIVAQRVSSFPAAQTLRVDSVGRRETRFGDWSIRAETMEGTPASPAFDDAREVYLNQAAVTGDLSVRPPESGDRYQPFRFHGHKKLADMFADARIPAALRADIPVVTDRAGILWPVGFPIAERARLGSGTRAVLRIRAVRL